MWVGLFVVLSLLAMGSLIARVFLAIRDAQDRRRHVKWAAASAAAMAVFALSSSLFGSTPGRRPSGARRTQVTGGGLDGALMAALTT